VIFVFYRQLLENLHWNVKWFREWGSLQITWLDFILFVGLGNPFQPLPVDPDLNRFTISRAVAGHHVPSVHRPDHRYPPTLSKARAPAIAQHRCRSWRRGSRFRSWRWSAALSLHAVQQSRRSICAAVGLPECFHQVWQVLCGPLWELLSKRPQWFLLITLSG